MWAGGSSGEAVTLTSLFDRFAEEEMLESDNAWYCSSCKCLTKVRCGGVSPRCPGSMIDPVAVLSLRCQAKKKLDVWNAPSFLVLHLKRFAFSAQHKEKIHTPVEFPLEVCRHAHFMCMTAPVAAVAVGSACVRARACGVAVTVVCTAVTFPTGTRPVQARA